MLIDIIMSDYILSSINCSRQERACVPGAAPPHLRNIHLTLQALLNSSSKSSSDSDEEFSENISIAARAPKMLASIAVDSESGESDEDKKNSL